MDWQAIWLSLRLSVLDHSDPARHRSCRRLLADILPRRWKFLVEAVVALPLVLPPTVLGFYILLAIGPHSPVGRFYAAFTGGMLPFSFQGLLVASVLYSLPFAVQPFAAGFAPVDRRLIEASWCLGVSRLATFFRVMVPLSIPAIVTGMILSFAHTLGEFGVVLMVGGNLAGITRTVSISILRRRAGAQLQRRARRLRRCCWASLFWCWRPPTDSGGRAWAVWPHNGGRPQRRHTQILRRWSADRGGAPIPLGRTFRHGIVRAFRGR